MSKTYHLFYILWIGIFVVSYFLINLFTQNKNKYDHRIN